MAGIESEITKQSFLRYNLADVRETRKNVSKISDYYLNLLILCEHFRHGELWVMFLGLREENERGSLISHIETLGGVT